jgi:hypothetical protein
MVVPVGIAGAYEAWPMWRPYPLPAPIFLPATDSAIGVVVGGAFPSQRLAEMPRAQALAHLSEKIAAVQRRAEEIRRRT